MEHLFICCLTEQKTPEGSWKCEKCNNINFPFRTKCNRQNCGADKPTESKKSPSPSPDESNQVCGVTFSLYIHLLLEIVNKFDDNLCTHNKINKHSVLLKRVDSLQGVTPSPLPPSLPPSFSLSSLSIYSFHLCLVDFFFNSCSFILFSTSLHPLICNCLMFQWVLGHVWGLRRSRVVVRHCSIWVSESQSCRRHVAAVVKLLYLLMICVKLLY